jgi:hypothetical protein
MPNPNLIVACYRLLETSRFLHSAAKARAVQEQTRITWETYRDSTALNVAYGVLFWKGPPGTAEIHQDEAKIRERTHQFHLQYMRAWLEKLHASPRAGAKYLEDVHEQRQFCLQSVQQVMNDATTINREVADEISLGMRKLGAIKLGSTIAMAALGVPGGLAIAGRVVVINAAPHVVSAANLAFGVGCAVAGSWGQGSDATIAAVQVPFFTGTFFPDVEKASERHAQKAAAEEAAHRKVMDEAMRTVRSKSQMVGTKWANSARQQRKLTAAVNKYMQASSAASQSAQRAAALAKVATAAPIVGALVDVGLEGISYWELWNETR